MITSNSGAFYATSANGAPTFGVLPIAQGGTGNTTGTATLATKLATARSIQVNLANTSAANFDGSTGISPGVNGILGIGNGGTGANNRLTALKNLTNEQLDAPEYFLTITTNWAKGGYTSIAKAKEVLGLSNYMPTRPGNIQLKPGSASAGNGGIIEFHYNQQTGYSSRIIENANGTIYIDGKLKISSPLDLIYGGTGLTASPSLLINLASTTAANVLVASPRPGVTGTLAVGNGGTGQTSLQATRNAMGLGNTTGALPVANGGTGVTSITGNPGILHSLFNTSYGSTDPGYFLAIRDGWATGGYVLTENLKGILGINTLTSNLNSTTTSLNNLITNIGNTNTIPHYSTRGSDIISGTTLATGTMVLVLEPLAG